MSAVRVLAVMALAALFSGCATAPPPAPERYSLLADVPVAARPESAAGGVIRVAPVLAPAWLRGRGICYRLAYHDTARLATYAESEWAAPVPSMLTQAVEDALATRGRWRAVIGPGTAARADLAVRVHLLELCQTFTAPRTSVVTLQARATVTDPADGRVLAQRLFQARRPAPTPDAAGGVHAARAAVRVFAGELVRWLANGVASGAARAAPGPDTAPP